MLRAILFDFNGVLVDDEPVHLEILRRILVEEGLEIPPADDFAHFVGLDDRACLTAVLEATGQPATADRLTRLVARKAAYYQARIRQQGYTFFDGAAELVRAAVEAGLPLGVVSGALRSEIEGGLDQLGFGERFKVVVAAEDVARGKPDPEGYRRGLELLNSTPPLPRRLLHPHEVLAIEDTPAGLRAATASGLATLGVTHSHPAERLAGADHVVASLTELSFAELRTLYAAIL